MPQDRLQRVALGQVVADEQTEAAGEIEGARQRAAPFALDAIRRLDDAALLERGERQRRDVADERFAGMSGDEVEPGARLLDALIDDLDEPGDAALGILLGQADDIGLDGLRDLLVDEGLDVPADAEEDDAAPTEVITR